MHTHTHTLTYTHNHSYSHSHTHAHMHTLTRSHRAKIEKDYGDKLMNLARTAAGKDEIG